MGPNRGQAIELQICKNCKIPFMEIGQSVKVKCMKGGWHSRVETFKGTIIFLNENHVTIKGKNYCSSFTMEQFKRGEVKLLNV